MLKYFFILGERCSGTNYLHHLIEKNFHLEYKEWHHKHFFGFSDYPDSDETLFLAIVRHPVEWLASFRKTPHHLEYRGELAPKSMPWRDFLEMPIKSIHTFKADQERFKDLERGQEIVTDRNMVTKSGYRDVFELRRVKNQFLIDRMPELVKSYHLVCYESLVDHFDEYLSTLRDRFSLKPRESEWVKHYLYKSSETVQYSQKLYQNEIHSSVLHEISGRLDLEQEKRLGYSVKMNTAIIYEPNRCHTELLPFWIDLLLNCGYRIYVAFSNFYGMKEFLLEQFRENRSLIHFVDFNNYQQYYYDLAIFNSFYVFGRDDLVKLSTLRAELKFVVFHNITFLRNSTDQVKFVNLHCQKIPRSIQFMPIFQRAVPIRKLEYPIRLFSILNSRSNLALFAHALDVLEAGKFTLYLINNLPDSQKQRLKKKLGQKNVFELKSIKEQQKFSIIKSCHFIINFQLNSEYQTFRISGLIPLSITNQRPLITHHRIAMAFNLDRYFNIYQLDRLSEMTQREYEDMVTYLMNYRSDCQSRNLATFREVTGRLNVPTGGKSIRDIVEVSDASQWEKMVRGFRTRNPVIVQNSIRLTGESRGT
jgi:hypothetical protein